MDGWVEEAASSAEASESSYFRILLRKAAISAIWSSFGDQLRSHQVNWSPKGLSELIGFPIKYEIAAFRNLRWTDCYFHSTVDIQSVSRQQPNQINYCENTKFQYNHVPTTHQQNTTRYQTIYLLVRIVSS